MPPRARSDRIEAAKRAATRWIAQNGGQAPAARAALDAGVEISQQQLGAAAKGLKIGEATIDRLAALYGTTPDGLVAEFVSDVGSFAFRDTPGFAAARAEAIEERGNKIDAWVWHAIGNVVLPARPRSATRDMVIQLAMFLDQHCAQSGVRAAVRLEGTRLE